MKRLMLQIMAVALTAVAVLLATPAGALASATTLQELVDQHSSIRVGDKLFDNFTVNVSGVGTFISDPNQIRVVAAPQPGDFGLLFIGPIAAYASGPNKTSFANMSIAFDVTVLDPGRSLKDIYLAFNGAADGYGGGGLATITETAFRGRAVGQASVSTINPPLSLGNHVDLLPTLEPYHKIRIYKDILVLAETGANAGLNAQAFSHISLIEQRFSQVPEPATLLMLSIGSMVLTSRRKRLAV